MDIDLILSIFLRIMVAFVLALPVAWDREKADRSAGLRTFSLVAIASCAFMMIAQKMIGGDAGSQARVLEGLITGIGFVGGGAILKNDNRVHGTATAASIWSTGAMGAAVAYSEYEIATLLSLINFITLRCMIPFKKNLKLEDKD